MVERRRDPLASGGQGGVAIISQGNCWRAGGTTRFGLRCTLGPSPPQPWSAIGRVASLLRHPGLAQTGEISGFEQGVDLRHPPISESPQAGGARIAIVVALPPGFGKFSSGAFGLAF